MKKAVVFALSAAMALSMAGCSAKEAEKPAETEAKTEAKAQTEAQTEAKTEAAAEEGVTEAAGETEAAAEEVVTEAATEAAVAAEAVTEAAAEETEAATEAAVEETEAVTEAAAEEAVTEATVEEAAAAGAMAEAQAEDVSDKIDGQYKVALVIAGHLGDKSFYDSANAGLEMLKEELGEDKFDFVVDEMGGAASDKSKWEEDMLDYSDSGEYNMIITGSWQMAESLAAAAEEYPDQKFIYFDETYDFEGNGDNGNIYNIMFKQNEGSYLAGAIAGLMTKTDGIEGIDPSNNVVSLLGGQDSIVINDFVVGYIEGAQAVNPDVKVEVSYVGDFDDAAKGKDLSLAMFGDGADIGFNVAGNAGNGLLEAASQQGKYAIGVDSDQAALQPDFAGAIPTSVVKNVGNALYMAIKNDIKGELPYGTTESFGLADGGMELVEDAHYEELVPEDIRAQVDELKAQIINGDIVVDSALDMSTDDFAALRDGAAK